jgi:CRP-like cAMP-binding protein
VLTVLSMVDLFRGIPEDGLNRLAGLGRQRTFGNGSRLMRQGEPSESLNVILAGQVRLESSHPLMSGLRTVAVLRPGEVIGELGVLDRRPCSASAIAVGDTVTLELGADALAEIVLLYPQVFATFRHTLSRSLRYAEDLIEMLHRRQQGEAQAERRTEILSRITR